MKVIFESYPLGHSLKKYSYLKRPLLILFIIYFLATFAIVRANFMHIDDLARVDIGYRRFTTFGRYISEYLSPLLHGDTYLADASPLPQWVAILVCALASLSAIQVIAPGEDVSFLQILASIPIGLCPYFLQCIAYKYDSPYMAISILMAISPLLMRRKSSFVYMLCSILGVLGVCTAYQASLGIYPTLVILMASRDWNSGEKLYDIVRFIAVSAFSFIFAVVFFNVFLVDTVDAYVNTGVFPLNQLISGFIFNITNYYDHVFYEFKTSWLVLMGIIMASYAIVFVISTRRNPVLAIAVVLISICLMLMLAFGGYAFLIKPSFSARGKYGIGVMIGFLAIAVCSNPKAFIGKFAAVALAWCFFVFSFVYGNALFAQAEYTNFRNSMIAEDLAELECVKSGEPVVVKIQGTIGLADSVAHAKNETVLLRMVPIPLSDDGWWGSYALLHFYGLDNLKFGEIENPSELENAEIMVDNAYQTILTNEQTVYIVLK